MDHDPVMKRSIIVTRMTTEALQPLQQMFNELKRQKQQLPITMFFHKVEKKKCLLSKTLGHQHHLRQTSFSHHRFHLLRLLHLPKKMIWMTLPPFRQKVNRQSKRHNYYTITPLHLLIVVIVPSSSVIIAATRMEKSTSTHNRIRYFLTNKIFLLQVIYRYVV